MAKNKKFVTSVVAIATAAALLLSGTFAWQSINQTALNEASDVINPGGRLHDDFDGTNKDVYVENFAEEDIFARIQLSEYFAIIANYGVEGAEKKNEIAGTATLENSNIVDPDYAIHYFDKANATDTYWKWTTGGSTVFMPTFNLNKDSLVADINGTYVDAIGGISNRNDPDRAQYTEYETYTEGATEIGTEIYDADTNWEDEVGTDFENLANYADNIVTVPGQEHTAKNTLTTTDLISMEAWLTMVENAGGYDAATHGNYWVYDTDGWVYWSAPIAKGTATGLLLNGIQLNQVMDDTWYYAINVVAQFVTANDVGKSDNTGFYAVADEKPSADAETLLKTIGVDMDGEAESTEPEETNPSESTEPEETNPSESIETLTLTADGTNEVTIARGEDVKIVDADGNILSSIMVEYQAWSEDSDWTYDAETGILTLNGDEDVYTISDNDGNNWSGCVNFEEEDVPSDLYQMSIYTDTEYPYTGDNECLQPVQLYHITVVSYEDPSECGEVDGYDVEISLSLEDPSGNEVPLTAGEDYELVLDDVTGMKEVENTEYRTVEYHSTATLKLLLGTEHYGSNLTITAKTPNSSATAYYVVQEDKIELDVTLYDLDGNQLTTSLIEPYTTYNVVITAPYDGGTLVLHDSRDSSNVADNVTLIVDEDYGLVDTYDPFGGATEDEMGAYINDNGQLVTQARPGYDSNENGGGMLVGATVYDMQVYADANKTGDPVYRAYGYGCTWDFYSENAPLNTYTGYEYGSILVAEAKAGVNIYVTDSSETNLASQVAWEISGNKDNATTVTVGQDDESVDVLILTLGEDETSEEISVTVSMEGYASDTATFYIDYPPITVTNAAGEELEVIVVEGHSPYIMATDIYGTGATLTLTLPDGETADFAVVDTNSPNTVLTGETSGVNSVTLTIAADERGIGSQNFDGTYYHNFAVKVGDPDNGGFYLDILMEEYVPEEVDPEEEW